MTRHNDTTPPPAQTKGSPFVELAQNPEDDRWYWMLWSANGRKLAMAPVGYTKRSDAIKAIRLAAGHFPGARILLAHT